MSRLRHAYILALATPARPAGSYAPDQAGPESRSEIERAVCFDEWPIEAPARPAVDELLFEAILDLWPTLPTVRIGGLLVSRGHVRFVESLAPGEPLKWAVCSHPPMAVAVRGGAVVAMVAPLACSPMLQN